MSVMQCNHSASVFRLFPQLFCLGTSTFVSVPSTQHFLGVLHYKQRWQQKIRNELLVCNLVVQYINEKKKKNFYHFPEVIKPQFSVSGNVCSLQLRRWLTKVRVRAFRNLGQIYRRNMKNKMAVALFLPTLLASKSCLTEYKIDHKLQKKNPEMYVPHFPINPISLVPGI